MVEKDGVGWECVCGDAEPSCRVKDVGKVKDCASGIRQCGWLQGVRVQKELAQ